MANLFKDMPHLLGSITNLDGYLAMRAMESIKGELKSNEPEFMKELVSAARIGLNLEQIASLDSDISDTFGGW